ncbi:MAG: hypothetical protein AUJ92_16835 [Armatimonadetes bacterium CG2_30_59_28]|nr:MAG: hypothetical protein AUJ92_16835 [Armatimonadetes bacterium CG2_30_59_28]PIU65069.1 MAG: hypothetical protein COS85_10195 [Armatimonadetes bacterium CG07_land_8_20_14_0_80_59_28]PIY42742.1 MAG: hypothetical protein COZ05_13135 [Armatimonadetes bacterium CG_4_10_14_3_um_filter_59_10]PJB77132.1 MAG: hypothetical protein CO095_01785 [Armatimonadetes bacterium CG_4_9_14_3_um_filter_58_7]
MTKERHVKKPRQGDHWYFVDETGDPVFYDRHGNLIVGQEGGSPILTLGFIETSDPGAIRQALAELHGQIRADRYLQSISSIEKTNRAFHAKDDAPEVRYLVYQTLARLDFKAQFVVARKIERVFRNSFHANESDFYDYLVSLLFENVLHRYTHNGIYLSQRGTRLRQSCLEDAIRRGVARFEANWNTTVETQIRVQPQTAVGEPCLQAIDYMNWAVYRAFVRREMRYYRFVEDKVSLLVDRYDSGNYPRNWYHRGNPFEVEKASPL